MFRFNLQPEKNSFKKYTVTILTFLILILSLLAVWHMFYVLQSQQSNFCTAG